MENLKNWNLQLRNHARFSQKIRSINAPIFQAFNLSQFSYFSVDDKGYSACICSNHEWMEHYLEQEFFCSNPFLKKPGVIPSGSYLTKELKDPAYQKNQQRAKKFGIRDSLVIIDCLRDKIRGFSFGWSPGSVGENVVLNALPLLQKFTRFFMEEAMQSIQEVERNPIHILPFLEGEFYRTKETFALNSSSRSKVLAQMGLQYPKLTKREKECILLYLQGESARSIGVLLNISMRTVETYLENVKNKLNCHTKKELIKKSLHLFQLGIL